MPSPDFLFERCFRQARSALPKPLPENAPPGFATRVLAQLRTPETRDWTLWLLPRAVGFATLIAAGLLAVEQIGRRSLEGDLETGLMVSALEVQP